MAETTDYFIDNNTSNYMLNAEVFTADAMTHFMNALEFRRHVNTDVVPVEELVARKKGDLVNIRLPYYPVRGTGQDISNTVNKIVQRTTPFRINHWRHAPFALSGLDRTLTVDKFNSDVLKPAMIGLANDLDSDIAQLGKKFFWNCGTAGDPPDSFADLSAIQKILGKIGVPKNRTLMVDIDGAYDLAETFNNAFVLDVSKKALINGYVGTLVDLDIVQSPNVVQHTVGGTQTAITVTSTLNKNSTLDEISLSGLDATPAVGDVFYIANVYAVNPWTKQATKKLQDFVITETAVPAAGVATVGISPRIVMSDDEADGYGAGRQNVNAYPVAAATVTFENTSHMCNMAFHKDAIALAMVPIAAPLSATWKKTMPYDGLSMTVTRGFDIMTYIEYVRVDILYGTDVVYPEFGVRAKG